VGVATKMPMHNLREVASIIEAYIKNPTITVEDMMVIMPGPDFPTAGKLLGQDGVKSYYETGRGQVVLEGKYSIEESNKNKEIIVREVPYGTSPAQLLIEIKQLVEDKKIDGITDLTNYTSDENGIMVVIGINKSANANLILNKLLKHTCLRITYNVNQTVLIDGLPVENVPLKKLVDVFVEHRRVVLTNKFTAELNKAKDRIHILDGLINITKNIDAVIKLIRASDSPEEAQQRLIAEKYVQTEEQAKAVLAITLRSLTKLEEKGLLDEQSKLNDRILWLNDVLSSRSKINKIIIQEQQKLAKDLGDDRRTIITKPAEDITQEDLIREEQIVISRTKDGYIKRIPLDTYRVQNRGGKGVMAGKRGDDEMSDIFVSSTHDILLFFTNKGLVYRKKGYEIPAASRIAKGTHMNNILSLTDSEFVTNMIPITNFNQKVTLVIVTTLGMIKRSKLSDFDTSLKTRGLPAIKLNAKDTLAFAELTNGDKDIFLVTRNGKAIRYPANSVRITGRVTAGVRALNLAKDDSIAQMLMISQNENPGILVITELGFGKRTESSKYRCLSGRFAKGVDTIDKVKFDRNGYIVGAAMVLEDDSIILLTTQGKIIQIPVESVRSVNRTAMGVRVLALDPGDTVKAVTKVVNGATQIDVEE
jgi:DNA gyrase subunit A